MTTPTGTFFTYSAVGNREDLSDVIYNISSEETPFLSTIAKKVKATAVTHEWQTDSLRAAAANAVLEGGNATASTITATVRAANTCQISDEVVIVSGTQRAVNTAGRNDEMLYQLEKSASQLKRDMEFILTGNQAAVTGTSTTARQLRSLEAWYSTNTSRASGGANGSTTTAATDSTTGNHRAFTEVLLETVHQACWTAGGNPDMLLVGPFNRKAFSGFAGKATRVSEAESKAAYAGVDIYYGDYGVLKVIPSRFCRDRTAHLLEKDKVAVAFLRDFMTVDLAKTGDNDQKQLLAEYTLEMRNEAAHGVVADLTVS